MGLKDRLTRQERVAIEECLTRELKQARNEFERLRRLFDLTTAEAHALGLNNPDGAHALHSITREYNHALKHYGAAVKRFSDFILEGTPPTDGGGSGW